ncbi:MAG: dTMP kinase [Proteobacteria bacterium]|nr:MAG: dTMP kinase [Pseudomonadota bacterium]
MTTKARFITLEGSEGAGKTTALNTIKNQLEQWQVPFIVTREPGGEVTAELIRDILLHTEHLEAMTELLLMFAARNEHVKKVIRPSLDQGTWVVSDRFVDASFAYQGFGRKLDLALIKQLEQLTVGNTQPDLTLWLDVRPEIGLQRASSRSEKDRIEQENIDFFQRIREGYLNRQAQHPKRIKTIDANQSAQAVQEQIINQIQAHEYWVKP